LFDTYIYRKIERRLKGKMKKNITSVSEKCFYWRSMIKKNVSMDTHLRGYDKIKLYLNLREKIRIFSVKKT